MFCFKEFENLRDGEIELRVISNDKPNPETGAYAYRYGFSIVRLSDGAEVGVVFFAADDSPMQYLRGHLSYGVSPAYNGHGYAAKACRLIKQVALEHGYRRLFIGAARDNAPSLKTIENLGATPVTHGDVPEGTLEALEKEGVDMFVWLIGV